MSAALAVRRAADHVGGLSALGSLVGISSATARAVVWAWANRGSVPIEYCTPIEAATSGAVTRRDLRPDDWWRIWPELITNDHPAPAHQQEARDAA